MNIDYLIIGQGLSGTFLSYHLLKAGKTVVVVDEENPLSASRVASGVINPVTGRRIVRTWRIEELMPFAFDAYSEIGKMLEVSLIRKCKVIDFHPSYQMKEAFEKRLTEEREYLHKSSDSSWNKYFNYHFDYGEISPCLLIDINLLLNKWRSYLQQQELLITQSFSWTDCVINDDHVEYKNIIAKKIICCDGVAGIDNPFFRNLPYAINKGEAIIAAIPDLPKEHIYKYGLSIVPRKENLFWIGSSYEWSFTDAQPTTTFKQKVETHLNNWLKVPFKIEDHIASVRPANMERRPFVGLHPKFSTVGILNGMGTKGCSLAPFFAKQLTDYLAESKPIYADTDVRRFEKILARKMN